MQLGLWPRKPGSPSPSHNISLKAEGTPIATLETQPPHPATKKKKKKQKPGKLSSSNKNYALWIISFLIHVGSEGIVEDDCGTCVCNWNSCPVWKWKNEEWLRIEGD